MHQPRTQALKTSSSESGSFFSNLKLSMTDRPLLSFPAHWRTLSWRVEEDYWNQDGPLIFPHFSNSIPMYWVCFLSSSKVAIAGMQTKEDRGQSSGSNLHHRWVNPIFYILTNSKPPIILRMHRVRKKKATYLRELCSPASVEEENSKHNQRGHC